MTGQLLLLLHGSFLPAIVPDPTLQLLGRTSVLTIDLLPTEKYSQAAASKE
jgi:hypothetical protein